VIPAIQKSGNGRVQALATLRPAGAALVAAENHIERIYDRFEALLADPAIDAVYIPLPNHLHLPWTLKALSAGKHVLCEKPIACNAQEAREMANAADRGNLFLMEAFMVRFHPRSREINQLVSEGRIGEPCLVRSAFCFHMAKAILEYGDNVRLKTDTGVDVHVVGTLQFPGGGLATLEASFISALQQTFTVVGTGGGRLICRMMRLSLGRTMPSTFYVARIRKPDADMLSRELMNIS
jgi:xylose dehydrogenase (NAD/NADP)